MINESICFLGFFYILCHINHRSYPDSFFMCFKIVQQLAMFFKADIKIMSATHTMEQKYEQRMSLLCLFYQVDHILSRLPVDGVAVDIV